LPEWEAQIIASSSSLTVSPAFNIADACKDLTALRGKIGISGEPFER